MSNGENWSFTDEDGSELSAETYQDGSVVFECEEDDLSVVVELGSDQVAELAKFLIAHLDGVERDEQW